MPEDVIPIGLQQFMADYIQTYEQLEALLWFFSHRGEAIAGSSLARTLRIHEARLEEAIDRLVATGFLAPDPGSPGLTRYEPADHELDASVRALAAFYEQNRFEVVRIMAENSIQRLRKSALHTFAGCFLLGKPGKHG